MVSSVDDVAEVVADEPLTTKEGWRRFVDRQPTARIYHADLPLANTRRSRR